MALASLLSACGDDASDGQGTGAAAGSGASGVGASGGEGGSGGTGTGGGAGGGGGCDLQPSESHTSKMGATPDYTQTDPAYGGFTDGNNFCGPTAVSNSLMYLRDHGYPGVAESTTDAKEDQHDLIAEIASPAYMNTSGVFNGTPPGQLVDGLVSYLGDRGVGFSSLEWQGWVPEGFAVAPAYDTGVATPTLDAIKVGVEGSAVAWLMLAMGVYDAAGGSHIIQNGHWVTVVGHGVDASGENPDALVVHDPWTSGEPHFFVVASPMGPGEFVVDYPGFDGLTFDATGALRLEGDWSFSSPDVFVLGLVVLRMEDDCR